jgi:hypothetical protein
VIVSEHSHTRKVNRPFFLEVRKMMIAQHHLSATIMFGESSLPSAAKLMPRIESRLPGMRAVKETSPQSGDVLLFRAGAQLCAIMPMALPCHLSPDDSGVTGAWYWPQAWQKLRGHSAHMIVSVSGGADGKASAALLGQSVAAVIEAAPSALAVRWGSSGALWPAHAVRSMVRAGHDDLPLPLCISVQVQRKTGKAFWNRGEWLDARTQGMAAFGLMEIVTKRFRGSSKQLTGGLLSVASYLINSAPILRDGEMIGATPGSRFLVRQERLGWWTPDKAYRVYFV